MTQSLMPVMVQESLSPVVMDHTRNTTNTWTIDHYGNHSDSHGGRWSESEFLDWYGDTPISSWVLAVGSGSQVALSVLYGTGTLLAVAGNLLAVLVLMQPRRSKRPLTHYLLNLAAADLLMAVFCMPFSFTQTMLGRWVFGAVMCPTVSFMQVTSVAVSIYTNVAVGMDRYLAVCAPLQQRLTKSRPPVVILIIWLVSVAQASVQLAVSRSERHKMGTLVYRDCGEKWGNAHAGSIYSWWLFLATYLLPLVLLAFTYTQIGHALWRRQTPGNAHAARDQHQLCNKRKVTKMLVVLVIVFAVCWLPLHLFFIVIDLKPQLLDLPTKQHENIYLASYYTCHWLAMANSFTNPLIYCFLDNSFRGDMRYLLNHGSCSGHRWSTILRRQTVIGSFSRKSTRTTRTMLLQQRPTAAVTGAADTPRQLESPNGNELDQHEWQCADVKMAMTTVGMAPLHTNTPSGSPPHWRLGEHANDQLQDGSPGGGRTRGNHHGNRSSCTSLQDRHNVISDHSSGTSSHSTSSRKTTLKPRR